MSLRLTSHAFQDGGEIPDKCSKRGGNISPALGWTGAPSRTRSLALIVDDPDAPSGSFVHWVVYGIRPKTAALHEDLTSAPAFANGTCQGRNGFGEIGYGGPQPPSGTHRYFFHLYALDVPIDLPPGVSRLELDEAMRGHVLEETQLMGQYSHREQGSHAA
jgi:Raf kinase inhibitor-like YbhB/YbcL family protein